MRLSLRLAIPLLVLLSSRAWAQGGFVISEVPGPRPDDLLKGLPATLQSLSAPVLTDAGEVLFNGDGGLMLTTRSGRHTVLAAPHDTLANGDRILSILVGSVQAGGHVAFTTTIEAAGGGQSLAIMLFSNETLTTIARASEMTVDGRAITGFTSPSVNAHGHIAFVARTYPGRGGGVLPIGAYALCGWATNHTTPFEFSTVR